MIEFVFSRVEPILRGGLVQAWVVGLSALNPATGASAYIDAEVPVQTPKALADWTQDEILDFCKARALQTSTIVGEDGQLIPGANWYEILERQIAAQEAAPVRGTPVDLSKKKMKYKGKYEAGVEYLPGDIVKYEIETPERETVEAAFEAKGKTKETPPGKTWKELIRQPPRRGRN